MLGITSMGNKTHPPDALMFESFNEFLCGSCWFVNFPNFNSSVITEAESDSILRDPLDTRNRILTFDCVEMKLPVVDRAGIEQENFVYELKGRKS
jgi:hypothetical protein